MTRRFFGILAAAVLALWALPVEAGCYECDSAENCRDVAQDAGGKSECVDWTHCHGEQGCTGRCSVGGSDCSGAPCGCLDDADSRGEIIPHGMPVEGLLRPHPIASTGDAVCS